MDTTDRKQAPDAALESAEKAVSELARGELYYPSALLRLLGALRNMASEAASFDRSGSLEEFEQRMFMMFLAAAAAAAQEVAIKNSAFVNFTHEMGLAFDDLERSVNHAGRI